MTDQKKDKKDLKVIKTRSIDECPKKEGDNCLVPGGFNDSEPIGGG
jgi:hypothetical protein